jgi:hypothetical protein
LYFDSDKRRARERFRKQFDKQQKAARKSAAKRESASKRGAEGPKRSVPGGYSANYLPGREKKNHRA